MHNKKFLEIVKPNFRNKGLNSDKMLLKKKGEFVSDEKQVASVMNKFFINITKSLKLKKHQGNPPVTFQDIIKKFVFHRVLIKLEKRMNAEKSFLSSK